MNKKRHRTKPIIFRNKEFSSNVFGWVLLIFFILIIIFNLYVLFFKIPIPTSGQAITSSGSVSFEIIDTNLFINITNPLNISYDFLYNSSGVYSLWLNVTSSFDTSGWTWTYILQDLRYGGYRDGPSGVSFNPNISIAAFRWDNFLHVTASDGSDTELSANVTFYVDVPNTCPIIDPNINTTLHVCENDYLDYAFIVTDNDDEYPLTKRIQYDSPPFYLVNGDEVNFTADYYRITSPDLTKDRVGIDKGSRTYTETIFLNDSICGDFKDVDIVVIEINNAPIFVEDLGVQTLEVWTLGDNMTFYHKKLVTDEEEGNQDSPGLLFDITIINQSGDLVNLFNITDDGVMNFTANDSIHEFGTYNISVCVNDTGIAFPHPNIERECGQNGSSITVCDDFSLTITDRNRPPIITDYNPKNLSFNASGTSLLHFNITDYDPDYNTIPDTYWYVDNVSIEYDNASFVDTFEYAFACDVSGLHTVSVDSTDGLLNDSLTWIINVIPVSCPSPPGGGGGGGGGGGTSCTPNWGCGEWAVCQNLEKSLEAGLLSGDDYRYFSSLCEKYDLDERTCGFKLRNCIDLNNCSNTFNKPNETDFCYYTENPSCEDGIANCHHGSCELLVDCGGPCEACPTCSDGIQNQGELGVDCEGPCPFSCPEIKPFPFKTYMIYLFFLILLILIIILIIKIVRIIRTRRRLGVKII